MDTKNAWGRVPNRANFVDDHHFQQAMQAWQEGTKRTFAQWRDAHRTRKNAKGYGDKASLLKAKHTFVNEHEFNLALAFWQDNHKQTESYRNVLAHQRDNIDHIRQVRRQNGTGKETRICKHEGCNTQASFGKDAREFCKTHKSEVTNRTPGCGRTCSHDGCTQQPSFGLPGKGPRFCSNHARNLYGYVDVVSMRCCTEGCEVQASYAKQVGDKRSHCTTHGKALGYVDVNSRICTTEGCCVKASFGINNNRQKCKEHKEEGMIDVVTLVCEEDACDSPAKYAPLGSKPKWCHRHKVHHPDIVYTPTKRCSANGCRRFADHGQFHKPTTCDLHVAASRDFNLVEKECASCHLVDVLDPHTNQCEHCGDWVVASTGLAQRRVKHLFDVNNIEYIQERAIGDTKLVPDFRIDTPTHAVVVEVDEDQHKNSMYTTSSRYKSRDGERLRMRDMVEHDPTIKVFIRYNPDAYTGFKNMCSRERHVVLLSTTQAAIDTPHTDTPPVVTKLFYDGYTGNASFVEL